MRLTTRSRATGSIAAVVLLAAAALAACGTDADVPVGSEAVCGDPVDAAGLTLEGLGAADVLLVESSGPFEDVVVYTDGRVVVVGVNASDWSRALKRERDADAAAAAVADAAAALPGSAVVLPAMAWTPHPDSPFLLVGRLPGCALEDLETLARELGDVVTSTDGELGDPMVTDSSTTAISYRGDVAVEASAYALEQTFEEGLTRAQRDGRAFMRAMQDAVRWNLSDVVEVAPGAFEFHADTAGSCEPITDSDEVADVLAAYEAGDDDVEARAVPPGIEPCG